MAARGFALSIAAALALGAWSVVQAGEHPVPAAMMRPAAFTESPQSLQKRIRFPKVEGDLHITLNCDSYVSDAGYLYETYCFAPGPRLDRFEASVGPAAWWAVIAPAVVAGRARAVWFQYRVEFEQRGTRKSVRTYPNQGLQVGIFGADYSGPQRMLDTKAPPIPRSCRTRVRAWLAATISEEGQPEAVAIEHNGTASAECRGDLTNLMLASRFVPAFAGGEPVRAQYREAFFSQSDKRPKGLDSE